ncbi:MAG: DUF5679 domain-containing protein [archaeon]|nr:DUF5679 domain-containing protein [archaeon]MCR4323673.1 DUF5679 domain-containing protein [Nanoarchaeota archaeon]
MEGHCMKCKERKTMKDAQMTMTKRGGFMAKGKCGSCGTTICAICSKDNAEKAIKAGEAKKAF